MWTTTAAADKDLNGLVSFTDVVVSVATVSSLIRSTQCVETQISFASDDIRREFAVESCPFDVRSWVSSDGASEFSDRVLFLVDDQRRNCDDRCFVVNVS